MSFQGRSERKVSSEKKGYFTVGLLKSKGPFRVNLLEERVL